MKELSSEGFKYRGFGVASGPGPNYWLEALEIGVNIDCPLDQENSRAMVVRIGRELRDQINGSKCAQQLFERIPIMSNNVEVSLHSSESGANRYYPYFRSVALYRGKVLYRGQLGPDSQGYDYRYEETLEEALQKLGETRF